MPPVFAAVRPHCGEPDPTKPSSGWRVDKLLAKGVVEWTPAQPDAARQLKGRYWRACVAFRSPLPIAFVLKSGELRGLVNAYHRSFRGITAVA
jgi:hypothetical protein